MNEPVYVLAPRYDNALDWARKNNIPRPNVRYIRWEHDIYGVARGTKVYVLPCGDFGAIADRYGVCRAQGMDLEFTEY